jgi:dTDP-glucose 4,6-dehydratase
MSSRQPTWLVTGGAGFIGRALVRQLLSQQPRRRVVVIDAMTYAAHPVALDGLAELGDLEVVEGDIADSALVERLMERLRPELVLNLAAESHVDRSLRDSTPFLRTNIIGTQVLLQAALRHAVGRFVQVSTDEVYGDRRGLRAAREGDAVRPSNPYSISKACADSLLQAAVRSHGLDAVVTRGCNTYGPGQFPEKLLPLAALRWSRGQPMWVYGDGQQERTWIHVDDHAAGILAAATSGRSGGIYHLRHGAPRSNEQTLRDWHAALGVAGAVDELLQESADRPGHDRRYALSDAKTRRELGWRPSTPWKRGLSATARWLHHYPRFWDSALGRADFARYFEGQYGTSWSPSP